ncbi:OmpA family protein [soil metagenome]
MRALNHRWSFLLLLLPLLGITFFQMGCAGMSRTGQGAVIGAGSGAVVGGIIGRATGSAAQGAIVGAAVGGAAGAIIGREMDRQAQELDRELDNATVVTVTDPQTGETAGIQIVFDNQLLFDFDSDRLRSDVQADLRQLARSLQNYNNHDALIVGHTDSTGPAEYNQRLSERRASAVRSFLATQGVSGNRLQMVGMGETQPVASNQTASGRQQNRRVEIAIFANEAYRRQLQNQN